jgi:hypothetical protein
MREAAVARAEELVGMVEQALTEILARYKPCTNRSSGPRHPGHDCKTRC